MKPAVIFDLDGTLIDSMPDIHHAANRVLQAERLAPLPFDTVRGFVGRGVPHLLGKLLEASGKAGDSDLLARMTQAFLTDYETAVGLTLVYPGVAPALAALQAMGHPLAICTNKPEAPTRAVLAHLGLIRFFPVIVGGDRLGRRKPDPAMLHLAVTESGGGPAIFVGDSEVDAETAVAAGLPFLLFTEGYRKSAVEALPHSAAFDDFAALPGLVAGLG